MSPQKEENNEPISLSSALLAPVNSIFETQIHAARAFLNFILQMGFRHKPSEQELKEASKEDQEKERKRKAAVEEMKKLFAEKREQGSLTREQVARLQQLSCEYGDLYQQMINYVDNTGNQFVLNIPNLAMLPIKPLAISEADFSYEFEVVSQNAEYKQMGAAIKDPDKEEERPWFLINPKSIRGNFASRKENSNETTIKINVKVGNTEMPYGLEKLLVHLTNSMDAIDREDGT
ncbi:MAG TPA: DUF2589 domain-containing protein [Cyclobacteriaceae bacterium]|nr:DUF2589 domain-containing protein [Cyclobacteriaceae bacterium]